MGRDMAPFHKKMPLHLWSEPPWFLGLGRVYTPNRIWLVHQFQHSSWIRSTDRQTHRHGTSVTIGRIFAPVYAMWPDDIADLTCTVFPANLNPVVNSCARAPPNARSLHVSLGDMRRRPRVKSHSPSTCCLQCQTARKHDTHIQSIFGNNAVTYET